MDDRAGVAPTYAAEMTRLQKIIDPTLHAAWRRFERLWRPMAWWTFLTWVLVGLIIVPLSLALSKQIVFRGERAILGNDDLLAWMVEPEGLAYLLVFVVLSVIGVVVRFAGLFRMVADDMTGRPVNVVRTLLGLLPDFPALVRLCFVATGAALLLVIPLLTGLASVYAFWLTEYDINYFLAARPPEWSRALIAAGVWSSLWTIGAAYVMLRSALAFPAYLDGHRPARLALKRSWSATRGESLRVLRIVLACAVTWFTLRALTHAAFFAAAATVAERVASVVSSLTPILLVSGGYAAGTVLLDALLSFLGFSVVSTVLTKIYFEDTHLHDSVQADAIDRTPLSRDLLTTIRRWTQPARILPVLALIVILPTFMADRLTGGGQREQRVVVIAHRAGMVATIENTLAALERSIQAGADFAEIDVQTTRDSVVVVFHDADLMRLASDRRRIAMTRYEDLRNLDLGCTDVVPEDCRIATLEEFVERARGRIGLGIELKYYRSDPYLAERVVEVLRTNGMTAREEVMVMSLSLEAVRQVRRLAPDIRTGYLSAVAVGNLTRLPVDFVAVTRRTATDRLLRSARRDDVEVYVWTINDAAGLLEFVERGVDGIITDDPDLIVRLIDGLDGLSAIERLLLSFQPLLLDDDGGD